MSIAVPKILVSVLILTLEHQDLVNHLTCKQSGQHNAQPLLLHVG